MKSKEIKMMQINEIKQRIEGIMRDMRWFEIINMVGGEKAYGHLQNAYDWIDSMKKGSIHTGVRGKMNVMNCYEFSDGTKAYFMKGKKKHLVSRPGKIIGFNFRVDRYRHRKMKISYETWKKMIGMDVKKRREENE